MITARFDGGISKNPGGHGAAACQIERDGVVVHKESLYLGHGPQMTNNVAEFHGMRLILQWLAWAKPQEPVRIIGDSQIVINRMRSQTLPLGTCAAVAMSCLELLPRILNRPNFIWERRHNNTVCDEMCDAEIEAAKMRTRNSTSA